MVSIPHPQTHAHPSELARESSLPVISLNLPARRILLWLLAIAGILVAASVATSLLFIILDMPVDNSSLGFLDRFSVDSEQSFPTYFSAVILLLVAILSHQIARYAARASRREQRYWLALTVIFTLMSFEEIVGFHEGVGALLRRIQPEAGQGLTFNQWIFIGIPLVVLVALVFLPFVRSLPAQTRNLFFLAGAFYVGGSIGMEMLEGVVMGDVDYGQVGRMIVQHMEELLEKLGVITLIYALLSHLQQLQQPPKPKRAIS